MSPVFTPLLEDLWAGTLNATPDDDAGSPPSLGSLRALQAVAGALRDARITRTFARATCFVARASINGTPVEAPDVC